MAIGGIKESIFLISGVIYVSGMFLLFYLYQANPASTFTTIPIAIYWSEFGCILLMGQLLVGALIAPEKKK